MQDKWIAVQIHDRNYQIRVLLPVHFLDVPGGLPINIFSVKTKTVGIHQKLMQQFEDENKTENETDFKLVEMILNIAVRDFNYKAEFEYLGKENIVKLYSYVLGISLKHFDEIKHPDNKMLYACHSMARYYGGKPFDYLMQPLDEFMFNYTAINDGLPRDIKNRRGFYG